MDNIRKITQKIKSVVMQDGAGVTINRSIGTPALKNLDPFLLLDQFGSDNPNDYIAGFPDHPHRGFVTITYMLDGHMLHQDSMGNKGNIKAGGVQWMKAAKGIIHSEMPQQDKGLMRGFQLWVNLPSTEKMSRAEYQEFASEEILHVKDENEVVKIISGRYKDYEGKIKDENTDLMYFDVKLNTGAVFDAETDAGSNVFIYAYEGVGELSGDKVNTHELVVLGPGNRVQIKGLDKGICFILVAGKPIGEPIVQHGPFVMNSRAEIMQAIEDYKSGKLV